MTTYAIRPKSYRGKPGFHVGSRGRFGYSISIFVEQREDAELIRDSYELIAFGMNPAAARA